MLPVARYYPVMGKKVTAKEAARLVGRNERNVRRAIKLGKLKATQRHPIAPYEIDIADLEAHYGIKITQPERDPLALLEAKLRAYIDQALEGRKSLPKPLPAKNAPQTHSAPQQPPSKPRGVQTYTQFKTPKPAPNKRKKPKAAPPPVPPGLTLWRQFAIDHGVEPGRAWQRMNIIDKLYIDQAERTRMYRHWYGSIGFQRCDGCPADINGEHL